MISYGTACCLFDLSLGITSSDHKCPMLDFAMKSDEKCPNVGHKTGLSHPSYTIIAEGERLKLSEFPKNFS